MGARNFCVIGEGRTASDVFDCIVENAQYEHGHDRYNGTISTCNLGRCTKTFERFSKMNVEEARQLVEKEDYGEKYVAKYIDLGVYGYELVEVKRKHKKSDAKFKFGYRLYDECGKPRGFEEVKTKAEEKAMLLAVKENVTVYIKREYGKVSGNNEVCEVVVKRTFSEKKPRATRAPGKEIVPLHKFMFYGWAAE